MTVAVLTAAAVGLFGGIVSAFSPWAAMGVYEIVLTLAASVFIIGGYVFGIMVMRIGEVGFVSPFRYTSLIFALILGLAVFGEFPNTLALFGVSIIMIAGIYTLFRERVRKQAAPGESRRG
jgi:S-adenosylmethionine uptake transporter